MADPAARHLYRETQAWAGQQPLSTSKPLDVAEFGRRGQTTSTGPSRAAPQKGI
jgi:hypothetical protein